MTETVRIASRSTSNKATTTEDSSSNQDSIHKQNYLPKDDVLHRYDDVDDDESTTTSSSSINSQDEALCEMLGIPSLAKLRDIVEEDTASITHRNAPPVSSSRSPQHPADVQEMTVLPIPLPRNVHRHFHAPQDCLAVQISNVLSIKECQELIQIAHSKGLDYVTHATHRAPDGSTYRVQLQQPNPHKLSVFSHDGWVQTLWERLRPILLPDRSAIIQHLDGSDSDFKDEQKRGDANSNCPQTASSSRPHVSVLSQFLERQGVGPPTRLNPRLRILKYDATAGDEFQPHFDATTRIDGEISLLTMLLYLNEAGEDAEFEGGSTLFWNAQLAPTTTHMATTTTTTTTTTTDPTTKKPHSTIPVDHAMGIPPRAGSVVIFEHDLFHSGQALEWGTKYVLRTDLLFELSEDEWERRASSQIPSSPTNHPSPLESQIVADMQQQQQQQRHPPSSKDDDDDDDDDEVPSTLPSSTSPFTMKYLIHRQTGTIISINSEWQPALLGGLQSLGLADASMETFCRPGRFALSQMLEDVVMNVSDEDDDASDEKDNHHHAINKAQAIQQLINAAFEALMKQQDQQQHTSSSTRTNTIM